MKIDKINIIPNFFNCTVGDNIRDYRKKDTSIRTQIALAEKSNVSEDYITRLELGVHTPSSLILVKVCNALGITPNHVLYDFIDNKDMAIGSILETEISKLSMKHKAFALNIITGLTKLE